MRILPPPETQFCLLRKLASLGLHDNECAISITPTLVGQFVIWKDLFAP